MSLAVLLTELKRPYHLAKGILANVMYAVPSRKLRIIAVTGTDGKTTTATLIYHILKTAGRRVALISTVAAYVGEKEIETGFHVTSPDPFLLQKLLKNITGEGYEFVVLEVTSHGIHQFRMLGVRPEIAVLTNITHEHLDYHGTYARYLQTKASFLAAADFAVINAEDASYEHVRKVLEKQRTSYASYRAGELPDVVKKSVQERFSEQYNRSNAAAAYTAVEKLGINPEAIAKAVSVFPTIRGRMEEIPTKKGFRVVVDFAHTPNGLKEALEALRIQLPQGGRLLAVFGSAGLRDRTKRPIMGDVASRLADEVILTAEDPRTESVHVINRQIKEGVKTNIGHVHEVPDRREAIAFALRLAKKGDSIGIFGKGHERSLNLDGHRELPWSDQDEVRKALSAL